MGFSVLASRPFVRIPVRSSIHLAAFIFLFAPALAAQSGAASDQQLRTRVEQRLSDRRVRGIKVSVVREATIALSGPVGSVGAKQDLIAEVLKVDGVKEIVSEL